MTAAQLAAAQAVREELELLRRALDDAETVVMTLDVHCELSGIPRVNGELFGRVVHALEGAETALDAYDVLLASADKLHEAGYTPREQRTSPPAGERPASAPGHLEDKPAGGVMAEAA